MDAQGFLAALTPAVTDADARERFLADPKAVLAAAGLDLPEWFMVTAREGDSASEVIITVPALHFDFFSSETIVVLMRAASEHGIELLFVRE